MKVPYAFFDLDGTIINSQEGILNALGVALEHYGDAVPREQLLSFIGPPLHQPFVEVLGYTRDQAAHCITLFRDHYRSKGIFECCLYDGIEDCLRRRARAGQKLVLATSKPLVFARKIMEHFGLASLFTLLMGSELDGSRLHKADVIAAALEELDIQDPRQAVMIGDTVYDVEGARAHGMPCVSVGYGFGSRAALQEAGADYFAATPQELCRLLEQIS